MRQTFENILNMPRQFALVQLMKMYNDFKFDTAKLTKENLELQ